MAYAGTGKMPAAGAAMGKDGLAMESNWSRFGSGGWGIAANRNHERRGRRSRPGEKFGPRITGSRYQLSGSYYNLE
jgi:hypothetical protein